MDIMTSDLRKLVHALFPLYVETGTRQDFERRAALVMEQFATVDPDFLIGVWYAFDHATDVATLAR